MPPCDERCSASWQSLYPSKASHTTAQNQAGSVQQDKRTRVCATQLTGGTFGAAPGSECQPRCPPSLVLGHAGGAACQVRQSVASHEGHRVIQWPAVTRVVCQHCQRCPLAFEPHLPCACVCAVVPCELSQGLQLHLHVCTHLNLAPGGGVPYCAW